MRRMIFFLLLVISGGTFGQIGCYFNNQSPIQNPTKYSGNSYFDAQINKEYMFLVSKFGVAPDLFYFTDGYSSNAFASPYPLLNPNLTDGTIYIGFSLINSECAASWTGSCSAVAIILAHEFAHIVDFKYKLGLQGKYKELFADYLAGCYMHLRSYQFSYTNVEEVERAFYNKGDQGFFNPDPHGTPMERYNALLSGYQFSYNAMSKGNYNLYDAITSAKKHLNIN